MLSPSCCGFYSATGIIFLSFTWIMLSTQPFFIRGIDDLELARSNAFGALIMFCVTFAISAIMIVKNGGSAREYDTGSGEDDYNRLNIDLKKDYAEGKSYGAVATDSY